MKNVCYMRSPVGLLGIAEENGQVTDLFFGYDKAPIGTLETETPVLLRAKKQLLEYFDGARREFDVPLDPHGTPFQLSVWEALLTIPYGETRSYGQIAAQIGNPEASRAVGMANHSNPISIFIPCHRVIGQDGSLTGYGGGMENKKFLLELEQKHRKPQGIIRPAGCGDTGPSGKAAGKKPCRLFSALCRRIRTAVLHCSIVKAILL